MLRAKKSEQGQAMVEFALMLLILMALLVSMVHIANLLTYDYWAQQEARFLAFEQTWAPASYYAESGDTPEEVLQDAQSLHRPNLVSKLDVDKEVSDEGSLSTLIASLFGRGAFGSGATMEESVVVASAKTQDSIWHRTSSEFYASIESRIKEKVELVHYAYASITGDDSNPRPAQETIRVPDRRGVVAVSYEPSPHSLDNGIRKVLQEVDFGEQFCEAMVRVFSKHGWQPGVLEFSQAECGEEYNREFSAYLAKNVDVKQVFREYAYQYDGGVPHREALDAVVRVEIKNQFYSFFDSTVAIAQLGAVPYIGAVRIDKSLGGSLSDITRMITDARYIGSSIAVSAISVGQLAQVLNVSVVQRNIASEKSMQDLVFAVLHADIPDASYALNPTYLPVPPLFFGGMSALQNAAMENVLRGGEDAIGDFFGDPAGDDSDLIDPLIYDSNKEGLVRYHAGKGMFPAAARKFKRDTTLTSRFFLVTQPWHITRKTSALGGFRAIGTEEDGIGEETEEAMLRRRVAGLWLFPSAPSAFFAAPFEYLELDGLDVLFDITSGFDSFISTIKTQLINGPITKLFDALSDIPFLGGLVPTIPKFPAVRPAAYPGSVELKDQAHSDDDELAGEVRNFSDYIEEQQNYNPKAKPGFDNDTFD